MRKALRKAHNPMVTSMIPTIRSPHEETQLLHQETFAKGISSRSQSESKPMMPTPVECPMPQRTPGTQDRAGRRTASGAMATRWSGPDHTCRMPASRPVRMAIIPFGQAHSKRFAQNVK